MARLVPGAAARDERDLRAVPVGADHDLDVRIAVQPRQRRPRCAEPVDRLGDERFLAVDELFIGASPQAIRAPSASK
jgi:hypothetical protein